MILNGICLISLDLRMGYIIYVYITNNLGFWGVGKNILKWAPTEPLVSPLKTLNFEDLGGTLRVDHVPNGKPLLSHTVIFVYRVV